MNIEHVGRKKYWELWEVHEQALRRRALELARCQDEADDLLGDVTLECFYAFDKFQIGTDFKSWFGARLRWRAADEARKRKRWREQWSVESPDLENVAASSPEGWALAGDLREVEKAVTATLIGGVLQDALMRLDKDRRRLVLAVDVLDWTYAQAARAFGLKIGTVRSRLSRAHAYLRRILGVHGYALLRAAAAGA